MEKMKASMKEKDEVTEKCLGEASKKHNEKQLENPNPLIERTKESMKEKEKVTEKGLVEVFKKPNEEQMEDPDHSFDALLMEIASMIEKMEVTEKGLGEVSEQPNEEEMENPNPRNEGQGFTQYVISVASGEDVGQKTILFLQQNRGAMFIMSASGSISSASLQQSASSTDITYEGRFEIISLVGSLFINELGERIGSLNVCLSNAEGKLVAGGIGGPLIAAGPIQVTVGTFEPKGHADAGIEGDVFASEVPLLSINELLSSIGLRPVDDSSIGNLVQGNEEHQAIRGSHFMIQTSSSNAGFELAGRTSDGTHQTPKNAEYEKMTD